MPNRILQQGSLTEQALDCAFAHLVTLRMDLELHLLGGILAAPNEGLRLARDYHLDIHSFEEEDARLIFAAVVVLHRAGQLDGRNFHSLCGRDADRIRCFRLASRALKQDGYWDGAALAQSRGPRWSVASLSELFDSCCSPIAVHLYAPRLLKLKIRIREATEHLRYGCQLLSMEGLS